MRLQHVPNCTFQKCAGPVCFLLKKQTWDWHSIWSLVNKAGIQSFIQLLIICIICLFPVVGAPYETLSTSTLLIQATIRKEYYIVTLIPVALLAQAMAVLVQHGHCVVLIQLYSVSWMASNSLGAPDDMQKSFNFSGSYGGSRKASVNCWYIAVLRFSNFLRRYSLKLNKQRSHNPLSFILNFVVLKS